MDVLLEQMDSIGVQSFKGFANVLRAQVQALQAIQPCRLCPGEHTDGLYRELGERMLATDVAFAAEQRAVTR
jgi:hypothetical protein